MQSILYRMTTEVSRGFSNGSVDYQAGIMLASMIIAISTTLSPLLCKSNSGIQLPFTIDFQHR